MHLEFEEQLRWTVLENYSSTFWYKMKCRWGYPVFTPIGENVIHPHEHLPYMSYILPTNSPNNKRFCCASVTYKL
jgi:hypothetical protein